MEEKNEQRPLIVVIDDVKQEIIMSINKAIQQGLPCYLLSPIIENIHRDIQIGAKNELESARQALANQENV